MINVRQSAASCEKSHAACKEELRHLSRVLSAQGPIILLNYSNNVSCEFNKFRVGTHLCKLPIPEKKVDRKRGQVGYEK